jgi:hypothetical protein
LQFFRRAKREHAASCFDNLGDTFRGLIVLKSRNIGDRGCECSSGVVGLNLDFATDLIDALLHTAEADPDFIGGTLRLTVLRHAHQTAKSRL